MKEELDAIVDQERRGIERRLGLGHGADVDEAVRKMAARDGATAQISSTRCRRTPGAGSAISRSTTSWSRARASASRSCSIASGSQVLDSMFQGLSDAIANDTPEELAANRDMVRDLNKLLGDRLAGEEPSQDRVDAFLAQHGQFFPGAETLDDIMDQLGERMAAMQSLLQSMSPQQRDELQSMMDLLLRDDRLRWDLAQLAATLDRLLPDGLGQRMRFRGDEPLSLDGALQQMAQLQPMDRLADELVDAGDAGAIADVDLDEVRELMGDDGAGPPGAPGPGEGARGGGLLPSSREAARADAAWLASPRSAGARPAVRARKRCLRRSRARPREPAASAPTSRPPWEFGRPFHLDLQRTLGNAIVRPENSAPARVCAG